MTNIRKKTVVWFGVYQKTVIFSSTTRVLKAIMPSYAEAEIKLKELLEVYSWRKPEEYLIEEVDVTMRPWKF